MPPAPTRLFYRPEDGVAADFIPCFHDETFHLFYLKDYRAPECHGEGTPWFHLTTTDCLHFEEHGEALPRGTREEQDRWVFTGCVTSHGAGFHIFYTGHNSHFAGTGRPVQQVMRADSTDLMRWTKVPAATFGAPARGYEPDDWRDPFVFWNADAGEYWMLLAARRTEGPARLRGCLALCTSRDLSSWEVRDPFWSPGLYFTHECPDLFRCGDWWYLLYSTFSERHVTHYRMSRSLDGPWVLPPTPADDALDTRAWYAAKTASDGRRRYAFGWLATREGETDSGAWQWGGDLVVHEVCRQPDGSLTARAPEAVLSAPQRHVPLALQPVLGTWHCAGSELHTDSTAGQAIALLGALPRTGIVEAEISWAGADSTPPAACGLLLRAGSGLQGYYELRLEPRLQRVVVDRWPRPGDQPFMLERPLSLEAGSPVTLRALVDGSCLVAYLNDRVALSCRMYDHPEGALGLFVREGRVTFRELRCRAL
jgi:beta-fructofuranosidase